MLELAVQKVSCLNLLLLLFSIVILLSDICSNSVFAHNPTDTFNVYPEGKIKGVFLDFLVFLVLIIQNHRYLPVASTVLMTFFNLIDSLQNGLIIDLSLT